MTEIAELHPAFVWDCDNCGREQFERCVVPEMAPEDLDELMREYGIGAEEEGVFQMMPIDVQCVHCGAEYETKYAFAGEDE